ncbi:MAG: hypothetical protein C5B53_02025 [Candidatus Melainabacteria bacterium]|nr:MAG: hypothetical protein C5B53_02025 [Candidatus Melainabacteria bacterium]
MSKKGKKKEESSPEPGDDWEDWQSVVARRDLLISAWRARDELYKNLFGEPTSVTPSNYRPPPAIPSGKAKTRSPNELATDTADPGLEDQRLAIIAYGPDPVRPYWTYITAGISSPWLQGQPEEVSGFGCELMIKSPIEAQWPAQILRSMAFYLFNHAGTLSPGARIALNAPIAVNSESKLRNLVIWYADEAPDCWYQLPSGGFGVFTAIGITDDELKFAESIDEYGTWCIQQVLRQVGTGQVTNPDRESAMQNENIASITNSVTTFARQFKASSSSFEIS